MSGSGLECSASSELVARAAGRRCRRSPCSARARRRWRRWRDQPPAVFAQALEQLAHAWEGLQAGQVLALEQVLAPGFDLFAAGGDHVVGQEDGHELVAALADLTADGLEGDVVAEAAESLQPRQGVLVVAVDQRAVDIEDHRLNRHRRRLSFRGMQTDGRVACSGREAPSATR
jgi:hypothetical protein